MRTTFEGRCASVAVAAGLALAGCARSAHARFYQLDPTSARDLATPAEARQGSLVVAVGPLGVPDYLDRPQIVTRTGKNELELAEFDRWIGPLENDLARVLAENIAAQLPPERFFVVRWSPLLETQLPVASRVEVRVERFEGALGGPVVLRAQWGLFSRRAGMVFRAESTITEPVSSPTYAALVNAMSKAAAKLSEEIVARILATPAGGESSGR